MPSELIIGLVIVAAVLGLALYGLVALVVNLFGGRTRRRASRRRCVFCGNMTAGAGHRCDWCGEDLQGLAAELADLDAVGRQLQRFRDSGALKPAAVEGLLERVNRYRRGLLGRFAGPSAAASGSPFAGPASEDTAEEAIVAEAVEKPAKPRPPAPSEARPAAPRKLPVKPGFRPPAVPPERARRPQKRDAVGPVPPRGPTPQPPSRPPSHRGDIEDAAPSGRKPPAVRPGPEAPPAPPSRRKSWAETLGGFMERQNIRWGELIGGLLIVGSSVALVLSLWQTLSGIPYFPFFVFVAGSSAVFGAGLYAHHRWKLESTSRGLLVIATLLVPLNFLFMALSSRDGWDVITVLAGLAALGIFAWLVELAARVLVPEGRWLQAVAVLGSSAAALIIAWSTGKDSSGPWIVTAGCLPVALFGTAIGGHLYRLEGRQDFDASRANALFALLGTGAFALVVALGLLICQAAGINRARGCLSLPVALAGIPVLACGLTVVGRTAREMSLAAYHTAGTAIALVGMVAMVAALGLAWPRPLGIIAVGGVNCAALAFAAFYYRLPILHAGAIASLALAFLTGVHVGFDQQLGLLSAGDEQGLKMLKLILSGRSGTALGVLFAGLAAVCELLARRGPPIARAGSTPFPGTANAFSRPNEWPGGHAVMYLGGCGVVALVGLMLATVHGFMRTSQGDLPRAMILYAAYGTGSLALTLRWRRAELSYLGLALLAAAPMWCLGWRDIGFEPLWAAVLGAEALLMGILAAGLHRRPGGQRGTPGRADLKALSSGPLLDLYRVPLLHGAEIAAGLAMAMGIATARVDRHTPMPVVTAACLGTLYFVLAWEYRSSRRTWAGSLLLLAGLLHTLWFNYPGLIGQPHLSLLVALLVHASLAVAAGVLLDGWTKKRPDQPATGSDILDVEPKRRRYFSTLKMSLRSPGEAIGRVLSRPLGQTALLSSALSVPVLAVEVAARTMSTWALALCLFWLAGVWLVGAWWRRHAGLFAAHQAVLTVAALAWAAAWLEQPQPWVRDLPRDLFFHPQSLQAYGIALGLLSLAWIAVRIVLCGRPSVGHLRGAANGRVAQPLLSPHGPAVDRIVRHAVVCFQLLLVGWHLLPGIAEELLPRSAGPAQAQVGAPPLGSVSPVALRWEGAWILLGVLAAVLIATLWYRWRISMVSTLLLAATVPWLIAGQFAGPTQQAVASALRWGWAHCFVACSLGVWGRGHLLRAAVQARAKVDVGPSGPTAARATLLATTAVPVLGLTIIAALVQLGGRTPAGPAAGSFFDRLGPNVSYLVPLALVMLGLVGYAVRERSAGYAFCAGLVAELMVTLGYALHVTTAGDRRFDVAELVTLIQLAGITAAGWAAAWLALRERLDVWREGPPPEARRPTAARLLMNTQLGLGAAAVGLFMVPALAGLALLHQFGPKSQGWTVAAGGPLGWIALFSVAAASIYRRVQDGRALHPQMVGLLGMTGLGMLACTVQRLWPQWGYRTLALGWAMYAWFVVAATWWVASVRTLPGGKGPPQALIRAAAVWVRAAGMLAVGLSLKAALVHWPYRASWHWAYQHELLWAAAAAAVASAAGATMAVWRRREGWAFSAALGVNLAASLVVWHFQRGLGFEQWWLQLLQANVVASSAVALLWLAARRRLYQLGELSLGRTPLLAAQTTVPVAGNLALLVLPVVWVVHTPEGLPEWIARLADVPGWLGLTLAAAAAAWYLRQVLPGNLLHVVAGLGLGAGVLLAARAGGWGGLAEWPEYHALTAAWAGVLLLVLGVGLLGRRIRLRPQGNGQTVGLVRQGSPAGRSEGHSKRDYDAAATAGLSSPRAAVGQLVFPSSLVRAWVTAVGCLVLLLAVIHSAGDPARPWWSAGTILTVSFAAGAVAVWLRQPGYVLVSGLLLNVIGMIAWIAWDDSRSAAGFVQAAVVSLAAGSAVWSLVRLAHPAGVPHLRIGGRPLPFTHWAARGAAALLAAVVAARAVSQAFAFEPIGVDVGRLDWIALGWAAAAVTICLWDPSSRLALPGLYGLGLTAVLMGLCARGVVAQEFCQAAALELAAFVLAAAVLGVWLPRLKGAWQALRIPIDRSPDRGASRPARAASKDVALPPVRGVSPSPHEWRGGPADWFSAAQALLAGLVAAAGAWISLDHRFDGLAHGAFGWPAGRMVGPLAVAVLLPGAVLSAGTCRGRWREGWQQGALGLGLLALSQLGFVWLVPRADPFSLWLHRSVILMVAAVVMTMVAGLGLRRLLPAGSDWIASGRRITPVFAALAIGVLAIVLVQEGLLFDLEQGAPMGWPAVAAVTVALAALVAASIGVAVVPRWDPLGLTQRGRTAYVYAAEVLGVLVGLHWWLTVPWLFRLGWIEKYWMLIVLVAAFAGAGLSELFERRRMHVLSEPLKRTAVLLPLFPAAGYWLTKATAADTWFLGQASPAMWLLMGLFYGFTAVRKRSIWLGGLAVLAANTGLWVLWDRLEIAIYEHPQLWLIPIALAVLVAEQVHHDRLEKAQSTGIRYLALSVIYVSSTADMFIAGVGKDLLTPLVLMVLSVLGALGGILLRVRSFLYLGVAFLVLDIVTMVSYAAINPQTRWIAYVCGIALGAGVLVLVGIFEKRRNDVLAAVERLKDWQR